jgi:PAS domain S-box-containing protein
MRAMGKKLDIDIAKVRGFNTFLYLLVGTQLAVLVGVVTFFIYWFSNGFVSIFTAASSVFMGMLGLPLLFLLYCTNKDRVLKNIFLGLFSAFSILAVSGILWYVLSDSLGAPWIQQAAKVIMVFSYLPMLYIILRLLMDEQAKLSAYMKWFILFVDLSAAALVLFFAAANYDPARGLDIAMYASATVIDICLLAGYSMLILIYTPTQVRYILSLAFIVGFLSLIGDVANLMGNLGIAPAFSYSQLSYDIMLIFLVLGTLAYSFFSDIKATTVEEVNKQLDDARHLMADIIMQSPEAICIYDTEGNAIQANGPFFLMFDMTGEQLLGRFNVFEHLSRMGSTPINVLNKLRLGETVILDHIKKTDRATGAIRYLSMKAFPAYTSTGTISSFVTVFEDITPRVAAEEELKQAKSLVELYIDLMGHDINNMNQVGMGYLEIALDSITVSDDKRMLLKKPLEAMENSSRLIDNVKKLRRTNQGDIGLRPVDLGNVLKSVISDHGQAPGRDVLIQQEGPENTLVMANELLKDVFVNLVSNAIKHSSGPVRIGIKQEPVIIEGKKYYRVLVEDNGPGIPDEVKPVIFDRLSRGRSKTGGSGLGLYLVKSLVDNYGGTITVEDRVPGDRGQGTRFIVTLPAA